MTADYHVHTKASPDALGSFKEYASIALTHGVEEIGFSDHVMLNGSNDPSSKLQFSMGSHAQEFVAFREEVSLPVKLGVEMDFFPSKIKHIEEFLGKHDFDYTIGAVHCIGEWTIDVCSQMMEYERRDVKQVYEDYFVLVRELCSLKIFDILAHLDLIKIFDYRPQTDWSQILDETAEAIASSGICVEINTAGLRRPCKEIYPSEQFLTALQRLGVPIVLGSDAHRPDQLGMDFGRAISLAKKVGYTDLCTFERRKRGSVRI